MSETIPLTDFVDWKHYNKLFFPGFGPVFYPICLKIDLSSIIIRRMPGKEVEKLEVAKVITGIKTGNTNAFDEVVEKYQRPIMRYLYRLTGDYEVAQDLSQDTFIKAYNNILRTNTSLNISAWLYRIATNNAFQHSRRKKIIRFLSLENIRNQESQRNGTKSEDPVEGLAIKETMGKVPYKQRVCLILYYVEGCPCQEIAEILGISEVAVRKRISRGVHAFRRLYDGGDKGNEV